MTPDEHAYLGIAIDVLADAVTRRYGPAADAGAELPVDFGDEWHQAAVQTIVGGANHVARSTGDGASRTVILTRRIYAEAAAALAAGCDAAALKRGIDRAQKALEEGLKARARRVTDPAELVSIATQVAGGDEAFGRVLRQAIDHVGVEGMLLIGEARASAPSVDFVTGAKSDRGILSPYFVTERSTQTAILDRPLVLLTDLKLSSAADAMHVVQLAARAARPLLLIAPEVTGDALATLAARKLAGQAELCAVPPPGFGDRRKAVLEDLAVLTGARVVTTKASDADLGAAAKVIAGRDETLIFEGKGTASAVAERIATIRQAIAVTTSDFDRGHMHKRIEMFAGAAIIRPRAAADGELDPGSVATDCLAALRAAGEGGVVQGGGRALAECARTLSDSLGADDTERRGIAIVADAVVELGERSGTAAAPADLAITVERSLAVAIGHAWVLLTNERWLPRMVARARAAQGMSG